MEYKNYIQKTDFGKIKLYQADCMEMLPQVPDKYYDLCICDPPYGVNIGQVVGGASRLVRQVKIGGEKLSCPKHIGDLMIQESPKMNTLWN